MYLKIDKQLFKFILLIMLFYFIILKIPIETLPIKCPIKFTLLIAFIIYMFDQPTLISENFNNETVNKNKIIENKFNEIANNNEESHIKKYNDDTFLINNIPTNDDPNVMKSGLPTIDKVVNDTIIEQKSESCDCNKVANKAITKFLKNRRLLDNNGMLHYADAYIGDMGYSDIKLDNYIPLGSSGNGAYDTWELADFNILNTDRWKPPLKNTRECKRGDMPQPQPVGTNIPLSLKNWDYSRKITPPESINIDYINTKFNTQE